MSDNEQEVCLYIPETTEWENYILYVDATVWTTTIYKIVELWSSVKTLIEAP